MKTTMLATSVVMLAALLAAGCNGDKPATPAKKEAAQAQEEDVNSITIRPEMAPRIKIGHAELIEIADKLEVPSQVEVDEFRLVRIGSYMTGRIIELYVNLGDSVDAGTQLARITSPELTQAQLAYLRAASRTLLAERALERAHLLLAADVIGLAQVQQRESDAEVLRAELSAAKDQLRLLGVDNGALNEILKTGHILPSIAITVPRSRISGVVIDRNVMLGQVVQPSDQLFQVADLSAVWVVGNVPEQFAHNVALGQHVEIHVPALSGETFDGVIIFVADTVNPLTRTVMVRTLVDNPQRKLKPAMLANMHIAEHPHVSLVVPEKAVVREANRDYVFLSEGNNKFRRVPVELAAEINKMRPVLKGLTAGQNIVVDGAFHLDNERKLAELE